MIHSSVKKRIYLLFSSKMDHLFSLQIRIPNYFDREYLDWNREYLFFLNIYKKYKKKYNFIWNKLNGLSIENKYN